jgi:pullulanase/glycogen debranching enzyme
MNDRAWNKPVVRCLGVLLVGTALGDMDEFGELIIGNTLFLIFNAHHERVRFFLPPPEAGKRWERLVDTAQRIWSQPHRLRSHSYTLAARSVCVFRAIDRGQNGKAHEVIASGG